MVYQNRNRNRTNQFFDNLERLAGESSSSSRATAGEMSSIRPTSSNAGEISPSTTTTTSRSGSVFGDEVQRLVSHISDLYLNDEISDVTLIVENSRFPAHKIVLAARSIYFKYVLKKDTVSLKKKLKF
jgi:hypothetical protein